MIKKLRYVLARWENC